MQFSFEKLDVWQLSRELVKAIYEVTSTFPDKEIFGLTSQLRRASISISSNIAEGNSRFSPKDKSHFTEMAYTSLMEVANQLIIACDLNYLNTEELEAFKNKIDTISHKLTGLYNYQRQQPKR
ncbi:four helix bundle protein [Carboxylicivirga sp. N1Y90]|uniref:four helix bundle protein n=1 Tax=Carboxylicivirga fragile TaxID=3417571 RepID=UPI003D33C294|nr:four helix bundle protein [Marinilabiliaceae bacterium N1Y90]